MVGVEGVGETSLPSVRDARVWAWEVISAENWARRSFSSASACSSRVRALGLSAMSGVEGGASVMDAWPGGEGCDCWTSPASDELHHHPIF